LFRRSAKETLARFYGEADMTGYQSKKAAAQDKLEDDDTLTIAYQSGFYDGKKAAAQEPTKYSFKAHWEADGCIGVVAAIERLDGGVHLLKDIIDPPQRPWVGLSNEEMIKLSEMPLGNWDLILEVEAKLKEKNFD